MTLSLKTSASKGCETTMKKEWSFDRQEIKYGQEKKDF